MWELPWSHKVAWRAHPVLFPSLNTSILANVPNDLLIASNKCFVSVLILFNFRATSYYKDLKIWCIKPLMAKLHLSIFKAWHFRFNSFILLFPSCSLFIFYIFYNSHIISLLSFISSSIITVLLFPILFCKWCHFCSVKH